MSFEEMLETWRTQDKAPLYRVNHDLLRVAVQQEHGDMQREVGWDLWSYAWAPWAAASALLAVALAAFFAMTSIGALTPTVWDYMALVTGISAILLLAGENLASRRRQMLRERGLGSSLQDEIRRKLLRVDFQLARYGRLVPSLLVWAPAVTAGLLLFWVLTRIGDKPFSWLDVVWLSFLLVWLLPGVSTSRRAKEHLLPYRRRLNRLLDLLNANE